ncbi:MAG: bifunctional hydroxymethylpyrimidine kinase/phosphomethylpyrimidine kinase [Firmicutes bacterium]|nr:bifunctional hydroxymethylpyrimidine kinase/phosphomethylpyrimidine kinase [Bacillota bacterium]MCM1401394.1 bifunctional hydroxymethylpyrimidine kinase/phosphomethylpyrimidine kinase [Bacteroides sp.]MCM1477336.1 bifunctional hydroxymethylpyrimidine kinase/phosphomethylpyrimidine kinase [Bacteroides sp.]
MKQYVPVLSIAGSDSSGGAGIQADIKTISAIGCYAMTAITSLTAQNTTGVSMIEAVSPEMVSEQINMVYSDIPPLAVKTGMLCNKDIVEAVSNRLALLQVTNLVVDPVMVSTSGSQLLQEDAIESVKRHLFPLSAIVTPNKLEARQLTGTSDPWLQVMALRDMGCRNILLKGGDDERRDYKVDLLALEGDSDFITLRADAVATSNTHGTGCTLSSAIASYLALDFDVEEAVTRAKIFITKALNAGARVSIGKGHGPVNHLFAPRHMKFRR